MNFLAHIYLSGDNTEIMVGNFIGDFVKGRNLLDQFDPEIAKGIELHRSIDDFTDHHPVVHESKVRLRPTYRHYAPVIVDVFYDHFLSRYWANYHPAPLTDFSTRAYRDIEQHWSVLPQGAKSMLPYMKADNWLLNYGNIDGIERALTGMSRRARHVSRMEESIVDLQKNYDAFKQEFELFFPELVEHARLFIRDN